MNKKAVFRRPSSFVPLGFVSMFTRKGAYAQCGSAVPKLALALALMRLAFFGVYDVQDSHVRRILGWGSSRLSAYRTVEGMTDFSQGALAELALRYLGNLWGSVIGPLSNGIAFFIQGFAAPTAWRRHLMCVRSAQFFTRNPNRFHSHRHAALLAVWCVLSAAMS